ncbi:Inosose isomerase [Defluviimonas aquaemixtae]|uniref:Inosose isomerase n=1 Tax=Albidovulum aquaemixtae TaxID=1542388 RepID=A0A2R8BNV3_9RHOB|nr:TIM barrel protein [Defluviimonas aquaemixtae]SPH25109.1 Inosose isomerase [Defluviimonas aquaemixtae]
MTRPLSLAHLTVIDLAPPRMIEVAARIGYASVGLRLIRVTDTTPGYPLMDDPTLMRETMAALRDTGIGVMDIEFVRLTPEFKPAALEPFLEVGAELGAKHIVTAPYDPDLSRLTRNLAAFAELSDTYGLDPALEFFPWTNVPDLRSAVQVVSATDNPRIGVLLDTLHFDRSESMLDDIDTVDRHKLPLVHLCDAPVQPSYTTDELLHAARSERLPPGKGRIDLHSILDRMSADIPLALEIPMDRLRISEGSEAVAKLAFNEARHFLSGRAK